MQQKLKIMRMGEIPPVMPLRCPQWLVFAGLLQSDGRGDTWCLEKTSKVCVAHARTRESAGVHWTFSDADAVRICNGTYRRLLELEKRVVPSLRAFISSSEAFQRI
jgi:hypothetical protein